jgi:transcriptional regulator with XRE-family HTH domain
LNRAKQIGSFHVPRRNDLPEADRRVAGRLREYRESIRLSRIAFAVECGVDSEILSRIENCRAPLRAAVFFKVIRRFPVNPKWLATGDGVRSFAFDLGQIEGLQIAPETTFLDLYNSTLAPILEPQIASDPRHAYARGKLTEKIPGTPEGRLLAIQLLTEEIQWWVALIPDDHLGAIVSELRRAAMQTLDKHPELASPEAMRLAMRRLSELERLQDERRMSGNALQWGGQRLDYKLEPLKSLVDLKLTSQAIRLRNEPVPANLLKGLLKRLREATAERGMKVKLAGWMKVHPQSITDWITGRKEPSGETTLRLLQWVEQEERKQKSPGSAVTPSGPKTRLKAVYDKTKKPSPPER